MQHLAAKGLWRQLGHGTKRSPLCQRPKATFLITEGWPVPWQLSPAGRDLPKVTVVTWDGVQSDSSFGGPTPRYQMQSYILSWLAAG